MNLKNKKQSIGDGLGTRVKITCRTFITKWRFASAHLYTAAKWARKRLPMARPS